MSFNVTMLEAMQAEGLDLDACIRILRSAGPETAAEKRRAYDRERKAEQRAAAKSGGMSGGNPPDPSPNERDNLTPTRETKTEAKTSSKSQAEKLEAIGACLKVAYPPPLGVSEEQWRDFLQSPKRRKAGMSKTAYSGILNNLDNLAEHGFPPGEMIALAVERGWVTVKLEWVQNGQSASNVTSLRRARPNLTDLLRASSGDPEGGFGARPALPASGNG